MAVNTKTSSGNQAVLQQQIEAANQMISVLTESLADVENFMRRDETGWESIGAGNTRTQFSKQFLDKIADKHLAAATINPLLKRGVNLRCAYVWAGGVNISVRDDASNGQDINAVIQRFLDDKDNRATFTDMDARISLERQLNLTGECWLCLPTDMTTGRVRVRVIPAAEITRIRTDPEDSATEQLFLREFQDSNTSNQQRVWHPATYYRPAQRPKTVEGIPVRWDAPIRPVRVNRVGSRGVGDIFPAARWAVSYKEFLEAWQRLMLSLSRYAWRVGTRGDKAAKTAAEIQAGLSSYGSALVSDPNTRIEAISKSGASFDADSGRPLAVMVASALELPVTTLLGDPGVSGTRATAEDVTASSWAAFDIRRDLWGAVIRDICEWVIDAAVIAPAGQLRGQIVRDGDRLVTILPEGDGSTIVVDWPERSQDNLLDRMRAIQIADQTQTVPPLTILREVLSTLEIPGADEVLDMVTDDNGNFIPLDVIDARARETLAARGEQA